MSRKKRRCAARKCEARVNREALMCRNHWALVPTPIKREISAAYKERGGYPDAPITQRYANAMVAAVRAVASVEAAQAEAGVALDPETLFSHPDDHANPIHTLYDDDTPIGSDQPPLFTIDFSAHTPDLTEAFDWRKHMRAEFIILEDTTPCHMRVIETEQDEPNTIVVTSECKPCGIRRDQTFEINSCDTCNARGGTLSGEVQGDPDSGRTGYVEWFEPCDDCIGLGLCPGCSNATLYQGVFEAAINDIDTFTCEVCGWHYEAERFNDEPDYDMDDYRAETDHDFNDTPFDH